MNKNIFSEFKLSFSNIIFFLILIMLVIIPLTLGLESNEAESVEVTSFEWLTHDETSETRWDEDRKKFGTIYVQELNGKEVKSFLPLLKIRYTNPDSDTLEEKDHWHYVTWQYRHADNQEEELQDLNDDTVLEEGDYYFYATPSEGFEVGTNVENEVDYNRLKYDNIPEDQRSIQKITVKKADVMVTTFEFGDGLSSTTARRTDYNPSQKIIKYTKGQDLMGKKDPITQQPTIKAQLPVLRIGYTNPDVTGGKGEPATHTHYVTWYYRDANNEKEKLKELTYDTNLEDGTYYFVAIPGEGATINAVSVSELKDYTQIYYADIPESERSLTIIISKTGKVMSTQWKWRYDELPFYHLDYEYWSTRTDDKTIFPDELKTIYTTNSSGATGAIVKKSLPNFSINYLNPLTDKSIPEYHWHNATWYYYLPDESPEDKKLIEDDDIFEIGQEYNFIAELAENYVGKDYNGNNRDDGGLTDYSLIPYPEEANEDKRTLKIKIASYTENIEVSDLKWIDSDNDKYELNYYMENPIKIYSQKNINENNYSFDGNAIKNKLPKFSLSYINPNKTYDLYFKRIADHVYKAENWQYRKVDEPVGANKPYNWENLTLECDENNYCGDYIFTAAIGDPIDSDVISNSRFLDLNEYENKLSIKVSFLRDDYFSNNILQSANDSYDLTVNMFDYWLDNTPGKSDSINPTDFWNWGINNGHALLFQNQQDEMTYWVNYKNGTGAVQSLLNEGYPSLNNLTFDQSWAEGRDTSESLAYLFDPTMNNGEEYGKASYTNVKGLFQKDEKGYYYYDYTKNSASFKKNEDGTIPADGARITLYNKPTISSENEPLGEFYPFNDIYDFFDENGNLKKFSKRDSFVNHYFGLTMEVPFRQTADGKIILADGTPEDMIFDFIGDDDVWVFIDDVLVLDIGGLGTSSGYINFSSGLVSDRSGGNKTLKQIFTNAGKADVSWKGNTFADNTTHTLKMFYLERANGASTLKIKFNLQPLSSNKVKKIDFDNNAIEDVAFNLYKSDENKSEGELVATLITNEQGEATFKDASGKDIDFEAIGSGKEFEPDYYLLKEIEGATGYRTNSEKILIQYDPVSKSLKSVDKYTSGVTTTFDFSLKGKSGINYKKFVGDDLIVTDNYFDTDLIKDNLVLAVPLIKQGDKWIGLYSNNIDGYSSPENPAGQDWNFTKTVVMAALYQIYYNPSSSWEITYDERDKGINTLLTDLPGSADRYTEYDGIQDMRLEYIMISQSLLTSLRINDITTEAVNSFLNTEQKKKNEEIELVIDNLANALISTATNQTFNFVNFSHYEKTYNSTIIVPNRQRELRIQKVDTSEESNPVEGAKFSIFTSLDEAITETNALATGKTDSNGMLSFKITGTNTAGSAKMAWPSTGTTDKYYLKEIETKSGYVINETIIPITIGDYAIYADAKEEDDGVSVIADVGKLAYNLRQYASNSNFNITLRDIEAIFQTGTNLEDFKDFSSQVLSYTENNNGYYETIGKSRVIERDGQIEVETGLARVILKQCLNKENCPYDDKKYVKDEISDDEELSSIFGMITTVKVTNQKQSRKISGIAFEDYNKNDEYDEGDALLSNINVLLKRNGKTISTKKTNKNGYYEFNNLQYSEYDVQFEVPDLSIVIDKGDTENSNKADKNGLIESIKFIKNEDEVQNFEHMNLGLRSANLMFTKIEVNDETKPIAEDGLFALYEYKCTDPVENYNNKLAAETECFTKLEEVIPDENGQVKFLTLKSGTYRLVEVNAPKGFVRPSGEWNVKVGKTSEDKISIVIECVGGDGRTCPAFKTGEDETLYLPNIKVATMPSSGGIGRIIFTTFGVSLMGFGILYLKEPKKMKAKIKRMKRKRA